MALFSKVLIANRGEIAIRIATTLRKLAISPVGIYSDDDQNAAHVYHLDQAVRLGASTATSYLDPVAIVQAAITSGAQAIHPGYGFLSENVTLARECERAGIVFIGPEVYALEIMGDKIRSKQHVQQAGVPTIHGISDARLSDAQLIDAAASLPFPLLIKPSAGGGGKGMYVVEAQEELADQLSAARRVAQAAFGDDTLLLEQLIPTPRHIEVQILADTHGNVLHLGERECSLQRRHQKIIEEAPSVLLSEETRARIGQAAVDVATSVGYIGAGTVEFLVSDEDPDAFYFMEMNTRLQVEHPVTEEITGFDLVEEQLRIAAGEPLSMTQDAVQFTGHAIEARVYAEMPSADFLPSTGTVLNLTEPSGTGIRVDAGVQLGSSIGTAFDPMIAKVIATGTDRSQALRRLDRALTQFNLLGVHTNIEFLQQLVRDPNVVAGRLTTTLVEELVPAMTFQTPDERHAHIAAHYVHQRFTARSAGPSAWRRDGFRLTERRPASYLVKFPSPEDTLIDVALRPESVLTSTESTQEFLYHDPAGAEVVTVVAETPTARGTRVWLSTATFTGAVEVLDHQARVLNALTTMTRADPRLVPQVHSPLPGTVTNVHVANGSQVTAGTPVVTMEAMKMEHQLKAPLDGTVNIHVNAGQQVSLDQLILDVVTNEEFPNASE